MSDWLIRLAYRLQASPYYGRGKDLLRRLMEDPRSRWRAAFDSVMIVLVLSSVILLIYETRHDLAEYARGFEVFVVGVFVLEYLARMWLFSDSRRIIIEHHERAELAGIPFRLLPLLWAVARRKLAYMVTPMAVIDLLAILATLPILRLFLIFRLLKLFRYVRNLSVFGQVMVEKRFEFYTLSVFVGSIVLVATIAIYLFEAGQPGPHVTSLMDALYWTVITVTTVGYGDIVPVTTEGRMLAMVLVFAGVGVISFATSIIVTAFHEKLRELRDIRVFSEIERLSGVTIVCGFGRIGQVVAERLKAAGDRFVVIDKSEAAIDQAHKRGYLAICGDATDSGLLANLGLGRQASRILCLTHDDVSNVYVTLTARQVSDAIAIISRANRAETVSKLRQAGADHVVRPYEVVARLAAEFIGQPVAFDALYDVVTRSNVVRMEPVAVNEHSWLVGRSVGEIGWEGRRLQLFGVIRPHENPVGTEHEHYSLAGKRFYFNPGHGFHLHAHDLLMLIGHEATLSRFKAQAGRGRLFKRRRYQ
ncbi:MAG: NAD-binding protein [Betaproteobacteria bacterium]|nr:NAD-binding protein [Betaproteobacteria bacterium]